MPSGWSCATLGEGYRAVMDEHLRTTSEDEEAKLLREIQDRILEQNDNKNDSQPCLLPGAPGAASWRRPCIRASAQLVLLIHVNNSWSISGGSGATYHENEC